MFRKIAPHFKQIFDNCTYKVVFGFAKGLKLRGGITFIAQLLPLSREEKFLKMLDLEGKVVFDIGGHHGIMAMVFSRLVGKTGYVITYEPNPVNFLRLKSNIEINKLDNVTAFRIAIGNQRGYVPFSYDISDAARGRVQETSNLKSIIVEIDTIDNQLDIKNLPIPDFIKIDVEGSEYAVLLGMDNIIRKCHPTLHIEVHGTEYSAKVENAKNIVNFLLRHDYSLYHVETASRITASSYEQSYEGHLYAFKSS